MGGLNSFDRSPSPPLAHVLGVMLGDGSTSLDRIIVLGSKDKEFIESFQSSLEKIGLSKTKIMVIDWYHRKNPRHSIQYRVWKGCKSFVGWYKKLTLNDIEVLLQTNEMRKEFVRGFYESEGNINRSKKTRSIRLRMTNIDKDLLEFINRQIVRLGINPFHLYGPYRNGKGKKYDLYLGRGVDSLYFLFLINPCIKKIDVPNWFIEMMNENPNLKFNMRMPIIK